MAQQKMELPELTTARTSNVRVVNPLEVYDLGFMSFISGLLNSGTQRLLQELITVGIPIAARSMIASMSYDLGGSALPVNTTFAKSSGWAVALIIVMTILCVLLMVLIAACVWWERRVGGLSRRKSHMSNRSNGYRGSDDEAYMDVDERGDNSGHSGRSRSGYGGRAAVEDSYEDDKSSSSGSSSSSHEDSDSYGSESSSSDTDSSTAGEEWRV